MRRIIYYLFELLFYSVLPSRAKMHCDEIVFTDGEPRSGATRSDALLTKQQGRGNNLYDMKGQRSTQRQIWKATHLNDNTWCIIQFTNGIDLIFFFTWQQSDHVCMISYDDILRQVSGLNSFNSPYETYRIGTIIIDQKQKFKSAIKNSCNSNFPQKYSLWWLKWLFWCIYLHKFVE